MESWNKYQVVLTNHPRMRQDGKAHNKDVEGRYVSIVFPFFLLFILRFSLNFPLFLPEPEEDGAST